MKELSSFCDKFVTEYLLEHPESILLDLIYEYDLSLKVKDYMKTIANKLESIFEESVEKYVFLKYSFDHLKLLLSEHLFTKEDEYSIVKALTMWLQYDFNTRMEYSRELFKYITIDMCSDKVMHLNRNTDTGNEDLNSILLSIDTQILVRNHAKTNSLYKICRVGIYDIQNNIALLEYDFGVVTNVIYTTSDKLYVLNCSEGNMCVYDKYGCTVTKCAYPDVYLFHPEHPPTINERGNGDLITIGGRHLNSERSSDVVMIYNTVMDEWSTGRRLPYSIANHATVIDDTGIYVIGGYNEKFCTKVICFKHGVWEELAYIEYDRQRHLAITCDDIIFCIGGGNDDHNFPYIERYDPITDQWHIIKTDVFEGMTVDNTVYSSKECVLYTIKGGDVYSTSLNTYSKTLKFSSIYEFNIMTSIFFRM